MEAEMNYSGVDATIVVPAREPDRRRDGFCVDQRQHSSFTHIKEIMNRHSSSKTQEPINRTTVMKKGEDVIHEAIPLSYKLPNSKVIIRTMKMGKHSSSKIQEPIKGTTTKNKCVGMIHEATSLCYKLPDSKVTHRIMRIGKDKLYEQHSSSETQELIKGMTIKNKGKGMIREAMPLSYKLPDSKVVIRTMRMNKHLSFETQESIKGTTTMNKGDDMIHEAMPLSYKLPYSKVVIRTMRMGKHSSFETQEPIKGMTTLNKGENMIHEAMPLSYKLPDSEAVTSSMRMNKHSDSKTQKLIMGMTTMSKGKKVIHEAMPFSHKLPDSKFVLGTMGIGKEREPDYQLFQQADDNSNRTLIGSVNEVQLCLHSSSETQEPIHGGVHEAMPVSFRLPESKVVARTMRMGKRWSAPRPYLPSDERNISVAEKVARLQKVDWLQNWIIQPDQRADGRYDFFFHHRTQKLKLRSLNTTYNYQMYGILPPLSRKPKKDKSPVQPTEIGNPAEPVIIKSRKRKLETSSSSRAIPPEYYQTNRVEEPAAAISVEQFMHGSYNNLVGAAFPAPNYEEDKQMLEETVEEFMRDSYENLIRLGATSTAEPIQASKGGKEKGSAEETWAKGVGKKIKATNEFKPLPQEHVSTKALDGLLFDVPIKYDFELQRVNV